MRIEFSEGGAGLREAEALFHISRGGQADEFTVRVNADLHKQACARLAVDEARLAELRRSPGARSSWPRLFAKWQGFFGPSAREQELGRQRIDALERADRAEASLFEAVAEASQAVRERDALREELNRLQTVKSIDDTVQ